MNRVLPPLLAFLGLAFPSGLSLAGEPAGLPFTLTLREVTFPGVPGLHSFAVARARDGQWLCVGGRRAGLHGQTVLPSPANFDRLNDRLWVIDLARRQVASRSLRDLMPPAVADSLTVVHPEFVQVGDTLFIVGGYGLPSGSTTMSTYRVLTVVDVTDATRAVEDGTPIGRHVRQWAAQEYLHVAGGELGYIDGIFYLVFGQGFDLNYGRDVSALRSYTFQVRPFRVRESGGAVTVDRGTPIGSAAANRAFRRRDLNVVAAIRPDGRPGLTAHGGVFRPFPDEGAWFQPIDIDPHPGGTDVALDPSGFQQRLCQYNCAVLPIFSESTRSMWTVFFGGISQTVRGPDGEFHEDLNLPFVDHIGCIARGADSRSQEFLVCQGGEGSPTPLRLPALLGTSARFIPGRSADGASPLTRPVELDTMAGDTVVGHVYGGISAARPHGGPTEASNRIFEVRIDPRHSPAIAVPPPHPRNLPRATPQRPLR